MAKKKKKTEKTPRELTHRQISAHRRQQRRQRIIFIGGVVVIAAIVLVVIAGWINSEYIPLHQTVITVNGTKFDTEDYIGFLETVAYDQQASGQKPDMSKIASDALQQLPISELMRQSADQLGITVADQDVESVLNNISLPVNAGSMAYIRAFLLQTKMKTDYFGVKVPNSDNQVWCKAMMLESDEQAAAIRKQIVDSDNFTGLASEYDLNPNSASSDNGDYGWHPKEVLIDMIGSEVPVDYAFNAEVGALSPPLYDAKTYKHLGYWLIRVNKIVSENQTNADAIFVSSKALAEKLRPQLESTDNISAIADNYTQYSVSKDKHGYLGVVNRNNMTQAFNNYAFSENVVLGQWSQPILDDSLYTQGGSWLVKVVDKAVNKALSPDDRNHLINKELTAWYTSLDPTAPDVSTAGLTDKLRQLAIDRATNFIQARKE